MIFGQNHMSKSLSSELKAWGRGAWEGDISSSSPLVLPPGTQREGKLTRLLPYGGTARFVQARKCTKALKSQLSAPLLRPQTQNESRPRPGGELAPLPVLPPFISPVKRLTMILLGAPPPPPPPPPPPALSACSNNPTNCSSDTFPLSCPPWAILSRIDCT